MIGIPKKYHIDHTIMAEIHEAIVEIAKKYDLDPLALSIQMLTMPLGLLLCQAKPGSALTVIRSFVPIQKHIADLMMSEEWLSTSAVETAEGLERHARNAAREKAEAEGELIDALDQRLTGVANAGSIEELIELMRKAV